MRHFLLLPCSLVCSLVCLLISTRSWALQVQDMTLVSPVTSQKFDIVGVPTEQSSHPDLADLGADDDGCRHTTGPSEYQYYIATDPYTYFSALTTEWDARSGRFREELPPDMKDWVIKTFNSDWQIDHATAYSLALKTAEVQGLAKPDRKSFVMPQGGIPLEKRYKLALTCYSKRGARAVALAKIALTASWALRAEFCVPFGGQSIDGGYEEVNEVISRHVKPGETFLISKWLPIYKDVFDSNSLTPEAYLVCGLTYFGLVIRDGDLTEARRVLTKMQERFDSDSKPKTETLRGLVRVRKRKLEDNYVPFLTTAALNFIRAIASEEFPRSRLPPNMMAVAECLRRTGGENEKNSLNWYLALAQMPETQPRLRAEIRAQGKALSADAPFQVQLGWVADQQIARLKAAGVEHNGTIGGPEQKLLTAIVYENFGGKGFVNPDWKPRTGGTQEECALALNLIGQAAMDFTFRKNAWPQNLDELWEQDVLKDRNRVNRFCCPVTGERFLYKAMPGDVTTAAPRTVVLATARPVPTAQGPRYGAYLANNQLLWSVEPLTPGSVAR